ncbi:MAG TPA: hypothetical protein PKY82_15950 [Pyrinomonadaceae bacterium]|nr:hypothetical protein [Pyrinomonadaceae bacterium]
MFKKSFIIIIVNSFFGIVAIAQPQSLLIGKLTAVSNDVYNFTHNLSDEEYIVSDLSSEERKQQLFDLAKNCLSEIQKVMAAGVPETKTIPIKKESDDSTYQMPISALKALCNRVLAVTGGSVWKSKAEEAAQFISVWQKPLEEGKVDKVQARIATQSGLQALSKLDEARNNGLKDTQELNISGQTLTVADVREQIVYLLTQLSKINDQYIAAEEARLAPFRNALSGDKLSLFNSRFTDETVGVYGAGGHLLKTPAEYASSGVWCEWSVDNSRIVKSWNIACWQFKGMTKIGGPVTRSGFGTPPASAFR